jgi:hypothetical protein
VQNEVYVKVKFSKGLPETGVKQGEPTTVCSDPTWNFHDGDEFVR